MGQYRLISQMRVASLTSPGIAGYCKRVVKGKSQGDLVERSSRRGELLPRARGDGEWEMNDWREEENSGELEGRRQADAL